MNQPKLKVEDFTEKFKQTVKRFQRDAVLVGIPETKSNREEEELGDISNAALLAINHFGSEINNIPPRPVMTIGLRNAQSEIAEEFKKAAQNVFTKGPSALETYYTRAGFIASNAVKKVINDQDSIQGPPESTLKARKSQGFKGTKSLVVTGQMRNAITFVVKSIWGK